MAEIVDFSKLTVDLERQELQASHGIPTAAVYTQLLALYLLENDVCNAKFLWKRIPKDVKSGHTEMANIWTIGQKMWQRDFPAIYESLKKDWTVTVKHIITAIADATRERAFRIVSQAYSSISVEDLILFVGLPEKEAVEAAVARGWEANAQSRMIMPKKADPPKDPVLPNEKELSILTDYVSFLEN